MYKSTKQIENKSPSILEKELMRYLSKNDYIYAKSLRRKVFLGKLPDAIVKRKKDRKRRLQCFIVACDILRYEKKFTQRKNEKNQREFEIKGLSVDGEIVSIHIREEVSGYKNKQLYFISCFYKSK